MSKVLKFVTFERDNPLQIKGPDIPIEKPSKSNEANKHLILNKTELSCYKFFEDESKQLLDEAVIKAREIIEKAKAQVTEIISKAEAEKEEIEKAAFDKGYEAGFEAGRKEQETIWGKHLLELNKAVQEIQQQNMIFRSHLEKECLKLSIAVAEKILGKAIELDNEYLLELIKKGLQEVGGAKEALIRIAESDYDKVAPLVSELKSWQNSITLLKDPMLSSGDCIITGPNFEIDAGIHTQIENIAETLKELEVI